MKRILPILVCSACAFVVSCGPDSSSDPQGSVAKPPIKELIPDGPKSTIGISSSNDSAAAPKKPKK